jgi:hypothetical protein
MKYILTASLILLLSSCGPDTFINHEMKAEKIGTCTNDAVPVKMTGNINGERYDYTIERSGDSLLVKFPATTKKTVLYKLTLDVDAKPAYHHIKLGEQTLEIAPTDKF